MDPPEPLVVEGDDLPAQELLKEAGDSLALDDPGHGLCVGHGVAALHEGDTAPATPGVQDSGLKGGPGGELVTAQAGDMLQHSWDKTLNFFGLQINFVQDKVMIFFGFFYINYYVLLNC